jgi:hypothetical protein
MKSALLKVISRAGLVVLGIGLALAGVELALRLFWTLPEQSAGRPRYQISQQYGWRGRPQAEGWVENDDGLRNYVKLNSQGFYDEEIAFEKPQGVFRVLLLGDSFLEANYLPLQETAAKVLQELLTRAVKVSPTAQEAGIERVEVINAGVAAWGVGQELLYFRYEGYRYDADVVALVTYLGNDVSDDLLPGHGFSVEHTDQFAPYFALCNDACAAIGGELDPEPWPFVPGLNPVSPGSCSAIIGDCSPLGKLVARLANWGYQHSYFYHAMRPLLAPDPDRVDKEALYTSFDDPLVQYGWELDKALVLQLQREVEARGGRFGVVIISPAYTFDPQKAAALGITDPGKPARLLEQFLRGRDVPALDLRPPMLEYMDETGEQLYLPKDRHWSRQGNRVAATLMHNWLIDSKMMP